jgi:hypothetical protein
LAWVAANGGPTVAPGLRDDLLAERMKIMADKITPTETFPDEAAARIMEVERKEAGRLERSEWFERFAYVQSDDSYFDMVTRREMPRHVFNALFRHVDCKSMHGKRPRVQASVYFDERRQDLDQRRWSASPTPPARTCWWRATGWSTATAGSTRGRT